MIGFRKLLIVSLSMSLLALSACDSGPDQQKDQSDAAKFLGKWKYISLTGDATCEDGEHFPLTTASGAETFTQGTESYEVIGVDEHGCRSVCQVLDNTAQCQTAGPECGDGFTAWSDTYFYEAGHLREIASFDVLDPDGQKCSMVGSAILERVEPTR